ncbi:MAG: hypothetical protein JWO06_2887 [Bacteroidota bacterium]|nr:hypothetical protein [Bacteroidota bacterium]
MINCFNNDLLVILVFRLKVIYYSQNSTYNKCACKEQAQHSILFRRK